jgi:CO/xanthine dehydrogenase FAD-binding subunit
MKTMQPFQYYRPQSVSEAVSLLGSLGDNAKMLAGGTDLISQMMDRLVTPEHVIDLKPITGLDFIKYEEDSGLRIGALTTISEILNSEIIKDKFSSLYQAAKSFGTTQVRNMATIGGNICRSSPSADMVPPLITFDAQIRLIGSQGERTIPLHTFFTGAGTNVLKNEILAEILLPLQKGEYGTAFLKLARTAEDLAKVNCAVKIVMEKGICRDIKIALGAVASTPIRALSVEKALIKTSCDDKTVHDMAEKITADIKPISDVSSNIAYRVYISKIMIARLITEALTKLGG